MRAVAPAVEPDVEVDSRPGRVLRLAIAALAVGFVGLYLFIALRRLGYGYELEWMEGGVVDHVRRVLDGEPLYGPPSVAFTPYIYTPLYYYVAAPVAWALGTGYAPLRLVSIVASLVTFGAIARLVVRETGDRWAGLVGAGLFAATFRLGGSWFDLARVDSLFLALTFAGLATARGARTPRRFALAGVLLSLAFLTKQQALLPALAMLPWVARSGRRSLVAYGATIAAGIGGSTLLLDRLSDGWYWAYIFELPARHARVPSVWVSFWTADLLRPLGIALVVGVAALVAMRRRAPAALWFHAPVAAALVATAYSSRLHSGGWDNVLIPAYGAIAVLFGLGVAALVRRGAVAGRRAAALALCGLQFVALAYDPRDQIPDAAAGDRFLAELRSVPGTVWVPGHGWYAARAGGATTAQGAAVSDVLRADVEWGRDLLGAELEEVVRAQRFDAVVVDSKARYSYLPDNFHRWYRPARKLALALPVTGTKTAPAEVWVPIRKR